MGRNVDLTWMLGAPEEVPCPECKAVVSTYLDDYDIEDDHTNPKPGVWHLRLHCSECEHSWVWEYKVALSGASDDNQTCSQCGLTRDHNAPDECDHCGGSLFTPAQPVAARYHLTDAEQEGIDKALVDLDGDLGYTAEARLLERIVKQVCPTYEPDRASPPGATIKMLMEDRKIHVSKLWGKLELTPESFDHLLEGRLTIDADLAQRLADVFETEPAFWLDRERNYRCHLARLDPAYLSQDIATECLRALEGVLKGPPPGSPNTLLAMVKSVCETRERRQQLLLDLYQTPTNDIAAQRLLWKRVKDELAGLLDEGGGS